MPLIFQNRSALWISISAFFLIGGYEFSRSPSNTLFLEVYSKNNLPAVMAIMPVAVILILAVYNKILTRLGPHRTFIAVGVFSSLSLAFFTSGIQLGLAPFRWALHIFSEAYIILMVEQLWSYVDSSYDESFAKKFNGPFLAIASVGGVLGGATLGLIAIKTGTLVLPYAAAGCTLISVYFGNRAFQIQSPKVRTKEELTHGSLTMGFLELKKSRLLKIILVLVFLTQALSTTTGLFFRTKLLGYGSLDAQTAFSGWIYSSINALSIVFQLVITPLLLRFFSTITVQFFIPIFHLFLAVVSLTSTSVYPAGIQLMGFKVLDYSLYRATKELFYIPFSFEVRYRTKGLIDFFGYRLSKGVVSFLFFCIGLTGIAAIHSYSWAAVVICLTWLGVLFFLPGAIKKEQSTQ